MTAEEFNTFCRALKATTHVVQWGDANVWKVGGKVFAIGWAQDGPTGITLKCTSMSYQMLCELPGLRPAPYLARGEWILIEGDADFLDEDRKAYIQQSYEIIGRKLTKKLQRELELSN